MATESPTQIVEACGKWGSANMESEDLESVLAGQRFEGRKSNLSTSRSGSAPPSIGGSFAAVENLMFGQNLASDANSVVPNHTSVSESEDQLRADPSYFEYYWAHINLNPRLPPPLVLGEDRKRFRNVRGTEGNRRLASTSSKSLWLDYGNLSTHSEESDDDRSPKVDNLPATLSPISNECHLFMEEPNDKAGNQDDSNPTATAASGSSSIEDIMGNMVINPPVNTSLNTRSVSDADVSSIRDGIVSLNINNFPILENETHEINLQQRNQFPAHVTPRPQILSSPQTFVGMNPFLQNPTNFPSAVQPLLNMTSETGIYPNMMPGYFPQQYTVGGYAFNPPPVSPYFAYNPFPVPFDHMVPSFSGQSQTPGANLQHLNTFYGQFGLPFSREEHLGHINLNSGSVGTTSPFYIGSPANMDFLPFPNVPFVSPLMMGSPIGEAGRRNERVHDGWNGVYGNYVITDPKTHLHYVITDPKTHLLLEELRSCKGRKLELSDIYGRIVEFSVDQHGSRFVQHKLEVGSNEEKDSIFIEVIPHAWMLMTDAFGNYVIQKFFELGNVGQKRELWNRLEGQVLPLSLQMYGCRVIQKALETFELEQKLKILHELEGHFLACVHDQNGSHVIQKCIDCIPPKYIKMVISYFRGRVASLSKHPYACRVIQTVLIHSRGKPHIQFIVDEILNDVYHLAQDQYGNYVTQSVLEVGKPKERSQIVHRLAGHMVRLSLHIYASNVIEKCLEHCNEAARKIMIEEITGFADRKDNLLVMAKDQFANYVLQKVLQTCNRRQREVLLRRIKYHLNSSKRFNYGKYIVARFEKLHVEGMKARQKDQVFNHQKVD